MKKMTVEIWSDIACPYCYIGKRKFEKALSQFEHRDEINLEWHSYELNPNLPKKASDMSFVEYFSREHGATIDEVNAFCQKLAALAKEQGLDFNYDKLIVANTSDALRLVKLANESGLADEAEEALFDAYFVKSKDVSDRTTLVEIGTQIGLSSMSVENMLDSDRYIEQIEKDIDYSENGLNLEYVPFYYFNNKHIIQGSIEVNDYLDMLEKAYSEWKEQGIGKGDGEKRSGGRSCSADGVCSL